jgi:hypothetical protein
LESGGQGLGGVGDGGVDDGLQEGWKRARYRRRAKMLFVFFYRVRCVLLSGFLNIGVIATDRNSSRSASRFAVCNPALLNGSLIGADDGGAPGSLGRE